MSNTTPKQALFASVRLDRRGLLAGSIAGIGALAMMAPLSACATEARVYDMHVNRDAGCGCCHGWMVIIGRSGRFRPTMTDAPNMAEIKRQLGVPDDLASCHTATVDGLVIEGHVPEADILRLLDTRPAGVRGLAVPGMPMGSPGMDQPSGRREAFDVFAFEANGRRSVFSHYSANF